MKINMFKEIIILLLQIETFVSYNIGIYIIFS